MSARRMVVWMADVYVKSAGGNYEFLCTSVGAVSDSIKKLEDACRKVCKENGYSEPRWTERGLTYETPTARYCCWGEDAPVIK